MTKWNLTKEVENLYGCWDRMRWAMRTYIWWSSIWKLWSKGFFCCEGTGNTCTGKCNEKMGRAHTWHGMLVNLRFIREWTADISFNSDLSVIKSTPQKISMGKQGPWKPQTPPHPIAGSFYSERAGLLGTGLNFTQLEWLKQTDRQTKSTGWVVIKKEKGE